MKQYIIPFAVYLFLGPLLTWLGLDPRWAYAAKTLVSLGLIVYYRKDYRFRFRWDWLAVGAGVLIFLFWVGLEGSYPLIGRTYELAPTTWYVIVRLIGAIALAPVIEEFFTRGFLMRMLIMHDWEKVPIGRYTLMSFVVTILFFGFSHPRWLPGLLTGYVLNLLLYKRRDLGACVLAHGVANLLLAAYVIGFGAWQFW